ncbi:Hachiman antiphage defense system protein HamA [Mycobacterium intracellulare]|uniref:Hachiman antiphage defense system protein HamA n=1 Tax=Mycobacterium intracellulare TaxID=1767 RepID=UPI00109E4A27|nr:Hachiman antiphage defense system protein HamA [Mycobacterium intracellulare]
MTDFNSWCEQATIVPIEEHTAAVLISVDDEAGATAVAASLPERYAKPETLAALADRYDKPKVAAFLRNKFPASKTGRSGDIGEILATAYLEEECGYVVGPSRLRDRDHQEWAMRGDDVLGAKFDAESHVRLAKVEAKSRVTLGEAVVKQAREGLQRSDGLPSPHSLTQFAERLTGTSDEALGEAVLDLLLLEGIRPDVMTNLMFLFTTSDPIKHVKKDLAAYAGPIAQLAMTLRVKAHQDFIKRAYEKALSSDA